MRCLVIFFVIAQMPRAKSENIFNELRSRYFSSEESSEISSDSSDKSSNSFSNSSEELPIKPETDDFLRPPYCGLSNATQRRINGGKIATQHQFPWMVALGYIMPNQLDVTWRCGGALITKKHVLTAAHCIHPREKYLKIVRLGALDILNTYKGYDPGQDILIDKQIFHKEYDQSRKIHDIGIVTLIRRIIAPMVWPICLPVDSLSKQNYVGKTISVPGWGIKYNDGPKNPFLEVVDLQVYPEKECLDQFFFLTHSHNIICAADPQGKQTLCSGDSGGPMMYKVDDKNGRIYYQVGLVSFGFSICGFPGMLAGFTEVVPYLDWIRNQIFKK